MLTNKKVTEYGKFTSNLLKGEVSKKWHTSTQIQRV